MEQTLLNLALALASGFIVGMERGWKEREASEGSRIAGIRTFGFIGLLGGLWQLAGAGEHQVLFGFAYLAFALVMIVAHFAESMISRDFGVTTIIAAMITFLLGVLAVQGHRVVAVSGAVVVAALLNMKPVLHRWLEKIEAGEIAAALKLLLISVVILPVLPDKGYGPWSVLNPYQLWWLVVLIAAISFAAYIAVELTGAKHGILLTGLLGGLVSSTGVSVHLARLGRTNPHAYLLAAGVLVASATMFVRVLLVIAILNRSLAASLAWTFLSTAGFLFVCAVTYARRTSAAPVDSFKLQNPVEIGQAVRFGGLLAAILLAGRAMQEWWGQAGLYALAVMAGTADVDAITISVARMTEGELPTHAGALAVVIAAATNTITKAVLVRSIGGKDVGGKVLFPAVVAVLLGGLVFMYI